MHLYKWAEDQRKQLGVKEKYNQDTVGLTQFEWESVGDKMPNWEPAADRGPTVEQPSQDEEEVLLWSEELGVNITVCLRLQLISHTQETSPFRE